MNTLSQSPTRVTYVPLSEVAERAARRLGLGKSTVEQYLKPAARDCVFTKATVLCEEMIAAGQRETAEKKVEPLFRLFSSAPTPELSDELLTREVDLDAEVAMLRQRFALNKNFRNRQALSRAYHRHESCEHSVCLALDGLGDQ